MQGKGFGRLRHEGLSCRALPPLRALGSLGGIFIWPQDSVALLPFSGQEDAMPDTWQALPPTSSPAEALSR